MKRVLSALAAVAMSMMMLANPILARDSDAVDPEIARWSDRIGRYLDGRLEHQARRVGDASGVATVKFNCTEDGRAANAVLLTSSGNRRIDEAAIRAVRSVRSYHPLPSGLGHGQPIVAWLSYDTDRARYQRRLADNRAYLVSHNAWYRPPLKATATIDHHGS